ncbi:MAG TPA: AMP-binding protein [Blastocatellia bacterium]
MHNQAGSLGELLRSRVERAPQKEFLFDQATGRVFTYLEFQRAVNRTANLLVSLGVRKGDRVSIFLTNRWEYLVLYFGCFEIGAWAGPINALLQPAEVEFLLTHSGTHVAITEAALLPIISIAARNTEVEHMVIVGDRAPMESPFDLPVTWYNEVLGDFPDRVEPAYISSGDEAVIIYTSGTTGKPKGVMLTHGNLLANAQQIAEWLRLTDADRSMIIMPLFHANALMTTTLAALWAGGSIVLAPRFSASRHWSTISEYGVTYFGSVATMLSMLNNTYPGGLAGETVDGTPGKVAGNTPAEIPLAGLRFALCGSAPVPVEVMKRFEELFRCPVIEGYGLSESTCRSTFNPIDNPRKGSVGAPIGNEMQVFDDEDRVLGPGEIGEIVIRGTNVMKGYYRNPEATARAFRSGWFHSGDLGYRDEDGFYYVIDRKGDMIIRGGENIYPREIDEVLYQHPKIRDAATIGVPDPLYGEAVRSFVLLRDGETADEAELISFCQERLAAFKCPKTIEFLNDIPKGPTGKLLKRELAKRGSGLEDQGSGKS